MFRAISNSDPDSYWTTILFLVNDIIVFKSGAATTYYIFLFAHPWCCNENIIYRMDDDSLDFNPKLSTYYVTS